MLSTGVQTFMIISGGNGSATLFYHVLHYIQNFDFILYLCSWFGPCSTVEPESVVSLLSSCYCCPHLWIPSRPNYLKLAAWRHHYLWEVYTVGEGGCWWQLISRLLQWALTVCSILQLAYFWSVKGLLSQFAPIGHYTHACHISFSRTCDIILSLHPLHHLTLDRVQLYTTHSSDHIRCASGELEKTKLLVGIAHSNMETMCLWVWDLNSCSCGYMLWLSRY